jgi:hypothetical protein
LRLLVNPFTCFPQPGFHINIADVNGMPDDLIAFLVQRRNHQKRHWDNPTLESSTAGDPADIEPFQMFQNFHGLQSGQGASGSPWKWPQTVSPTVPLPPQVEQSKRTISKGMHRLHGTGMPRERRVHCSSRTMRGSEAVLMG